MKSTDRNLGMGRRISRRDLLHGVGALATSTLVPGPALAEQVLALDGNDEVSRAYPPARTGLRGNHAGSLTWK